jgi:hypothetical protein
MGLDSQGMKTDNMLTGSLPSSMAKLTLLKGLYLSDSRGRSELTGSLPSWLGRFTGLKSIDISGNKFTGTIPSSLAQLKKLVFVYLSGNKLTGTVPVLPFKQYRSDLPTCCIGGKTGGNHFTCPLPASAAACLCGGNPTRPGVVCGG